MTPPTTPTTCDGRTTKVTLSLLLLTGPSGGLCFGIFSANLFSLSSSVNPLSCPSSLSPRSLLSPRGATASSLPRPQSLRRSPPSSRRLKRMIKEKTKVNSHYTVNECTPPSLTHCDPFSGPCRRPSVHHGHTRRPFGRPGIPLHHLAGHRRACRPCDPGRRLPSCHPLASDSCAA